MKRDPDPNYRHRFPAEIISHAIWLCHTFCLSFRDVELMLAERGVMVSIRSRLEGLPKDIREIAWKAQVRLLPAHDRRRQEGTHRRRGDRAGDGGVPVGDRQ